MHDPVITVSDGQSYNRGPIEEWFDKQEREGTTRFTSPLTNAVRICLQCHLPGVNQPCVAVTCRANAKRLRSCLFDALLVVLVGIGVACGGTQRGTAQHDRRVAGEASHDRLPQCHHPARADWARVVQEGVSCKLVGARNTAADNRGCVFSAVISD